MDVRGHAPTSQIHAALVDVLGVGVLLCGPSGVGKSECALELVQRGHKFVADDVVRLATDEDPQLGKRLIGHSPELIRHYMEIRGIGLLHIEDLYGPDAVLDQMAVDLICRLQPWQDGVEYERIGLERASVVLLGVDLPSLTLPVRPARSMATLVEVAVRDLRLRSEGVNAAMRLDARLRHAEPRPIEGPS